MTVERRMMAMSLSNLVDLGFIAVKKGCCKTHNYYKNIKILFKKLFMFKIFDLLIRVTYMYHKISFYLGDDM